MNAEENGGKEHSMPERIALLDSELVSSYGFGSESCISGIYSGKNAFSEIRRFPTEQFLCHKAGTVPGKESISAEEMLAFCAPKVIDLPEETPVLLASTIGEIDLLYRSERCTLNSLLEKTLKLFRKKNGKIVSAACASTNAAIDRACRMIHAGLCEKIIIAACDLVSEFAFSGFASIGAMTATEARPYDRNRSGLILGEAAGVLVLSSEKASHGPEVRAWITGTGMSGDALHITAPETDGKELGNAILRALGGSDPSEISCILGHGTGTVYNDIMELNAIRNIFGNEIPLASAKGGCGHTLGACGMIQTILAAEVLNRRELFPQIGLLEPETNAGKMVSSRKRTLEKGNLLSLNSGFGGINAVIRMEAAS